MIILLFKLILATISPELTEEFYYDSWNLIYLSVILILFGHSFILGDKIYNLIFSSISYEITYHSKKNDFYQESSGKLIETLEKRRKLSVSNADEFWD